MMQIIGDLLYLIRFPTMDVAMFAGLTNGTEVLTEKEKTDIFYVISHRADIIHSMTSSDPKGADTCKCDAAPQCCFPLLPRAADKSKMASKSSHVEMPCGIEATIIGLFIMCFILAALNIRMWCLM